MSKRGQKKLVLGRKYPKLVEDLIKFGRAYNGLPGICRSLTPLVPDCMRVVLSYGFNVSITASAGEVDTYVFTGNGLFDPDVTGAGSQPMGFDQWHTFYGKHRGLASSIEFNVTTPDAATNDAQVFEAAVFPNVQNVQPTSMGAARAMPYSVARAGLGTFNTGPASVFRNTMSTSELMGIDPQALLIEDTLAGTQSANASDLWYWAILLQLTDQAGATVYRVTGTVHYLVDFFDRNINALSSSAAAKGKQKARKL